MGKGRTHLLDRYQIDVAKNPRRDLYMADDDTAVVLGRLIDQRATHACFALVLTRASLVSLKPLLQTFASVLSHYATISWATAFTDAARDFGDELVRETIAKHLAKGVPYQDVVNLIGVFERLSTTQFEGRDFTTGLILTKSPTAFWTDRADARRGGVVTRLTDPIYLARGGEVDKRFWYLSDGQASFFLCAGITVQKMPTIVAQLFLEERQPGGHLLADYMVGSALKGADALFRTTGRGEASVAGTDGLEFVRKESAWTVRNIKSVVAMIAGLTGSNEDVAKSLLGYVLDAARARSSCIVWMPESLNAVTDSLLTKHAVHEPKLSILVSAHHTTIMRLLTSDGVTVVNERGLVEYFGCIVELSKLKQAGLAGTGESVAKLLGQKGLAIKVSQDGGVKIAVRGKLVTL